MSLFSKQSSISMQQVVDLIEDEDESWSDEAKSLSPRVKQARRCKIEFDDTLHSTSFLEQQSGTKVLNRSPFREKNSLVSDLLAIVKLSRINVYVDVLKQIAGMVIDLQAEKEPTSNKILGHAVTIWLHLQAMMTLEDGCSLYWISLAAAALEAFNQKFGDVSEENWHTSSSGRINKTLVVCSAFLDPFEHSQLKTMCDLAPGLDYEMMKKTVINEVRLLTPDEFVRVPVSSRCARFARGGQNAIEKEINSYTALLSIGESPLNFWRNNEKYFPYLATLARYLLSVPASSSPSERAFKELRCIMVDFTRNQMSAAKIASLIHIRTAFLNNI